MGALKAPIIGRDFFFFRGRTSTRLRLVTGSYNAPHRGAYGYPEGVPIISRDLFNTCARVREDPTLRWGTCRNFGLNYRDLDQN